MMMVRIYIKRTSRGKQYSDCTMSVAVKSRVDNKNARHVHRAKRYRCVRKPNHKNAHIHINSLRSYTFLRQRQRLKKYIYIIYTTGVRLFCSVYHNIHYMHLRGRACVCAAWLSTRRINV